MTTEKAWAELRGAALAYAYAQNKGTKQEKFFADVTLRGAARNYAEAVTEEENETGEASNV